MKDYFSQKHHILFFFDQRLTGLIRRNNNDNLDLLVALLNSILGIFYIEAIGFGRGLGVLDLNKNKVEKRFKILDPELISDIDKEDILRLYAELELRDVKHVLEELNQTDRYKFDYAVLKAFGMEDNYNKIKKSLIELFNIRKAINK